MVDRQLRRSTYLGNLTGLMVAPNQSDTVGVSDFEGEEKQESLNTVESSVHKVALGGLSVSIPLGQVALPTHP